MAKGVAIVTGGGSGIGLASALRLAGAGLEVAIVGRSMARLEAALAEIGRAGAGIAVPGDVTNNEDVEAITRRIVERYGRIDVLVNAAGSAPVAPLHDLAPAAWHDILQSNLSSTFYATRAVWPVMAGQAVSREFQARGVIVNISSMSSKDPFPGLGAYAVAKAGVNMLTLVAGREGRAAGIRVVAIAPAAVDTQMFRAVVSSMGQEPEAAANPAQVLQPDDVARMVLDCVNGSLRHSSGETLFVHRSPA